MTNEEKRAIALAVLKKGKTIATRYFPRFETPNGTIDWEIVDAWAEELCDRNYPPQIWEKAVSHWVNNIAQHGDVATTGDIRRAAKHIWTTWSDNPETAGYVENYRLMMLDRKYQQIIPGYQPGSVFPQKDEQKELPDEEAFAHITRRLKRIRAAKSLNPPQNTP